MGRSRSSSSSSSSSRSSGEDKHHKKDKHKAGKEHKEHKEHKDKDKKDKKDKDKKDKDKKDKHDKHDKHDAPHGIPGIPNIPGAGGLLGMIAPLIGGHQQHNRGVEQHAGGGGGGAHQAPFTAVPQQHQAYTHPGQAPLMPVFQDPQHAPQAPSYGQPPSHGHFQAPPHAIALNTYNPLPPPNVLGWPVSTDYGGEPLFLALVPYEDGVHPGKVVQGHNPPVYVSWGGREAAHAGDYAIVPFNPDRMYWAPSRAGDVPYGARPVDAGREADGAPLFHAIGVVNGIRVPGKAGRHLGGASVPFAGQEHLLPDCEILCWR